MQNYEHLYCALFNRITDLIEILESQETEQDTIVQALKGIQIEAEERFIDE